MQINPINNNQYNVNNIKFKSIKITDPNFFMKFYEYRQNQKLAAKLAEDNFISRLTPELKNLKDLIEKKFKNTNKAQVISALQSLLNSDGSMDEYALKTFWALSKGRTTDWIENIKLFLKGKIDLFSSERIGLNPLTDAIEACKDKNGNHNEVNLKLAQKIKTSTNCPFLDISVIIKYCKDENGVVSGSKYELFKMLKDMGMPEMMLYLPDENGNISQTAIDFVIKNHKYTNDISVKQLMKDVLEKSKGKDREEILKTISSLSPFIDEKHNLRINGSTLFKDSTGNINLTNVQQLIRLMGTERFDSINGRHTYFLRNNDGIITKETVDNVLKLDTKMNDHEIYNYLTEKEGFFDENGNINSKFVEFFNKMKKMDIMFEYQFRDEYNDALKIAKNKKGEIDWDVMDVFFQLYNKLQDNDNTNSLRYFNSLWKKAQEMGKDENGNFTKEGLQKIIDFFKLEDKYKEEISLYKLNTILKGKTANNILEETVKDKNLYEASQMLEVLKGLKSNRKLNQRTLKTPLKDWDSLMMIIPDILPAETNKQEYNELLRILGSIKDLDFNVKDKMGVSFLEKVIISENHKLLDLMKSSSVDLNYYPEIEFALDNIQNPLFKDIVENLNLKFADLEEAAKLGSTEAFQKLESQLDSKFMKDKKGELIKLQRLINKSQNKELKAYFRGKYQDEIREK